MEERAKRKLSAILSADVKGYSRLMGEDELGTVRTLEAYREMIAEVIKNYRGRVVDSPGDNVLAEFASVVDAVESAVEIQRELKAKNAEMPENRRMEFRIGINLGDVIEEGKRIYGDGVNVAARIEGLAEGGGICISRTAFDQVKNKLNLGYENLGEHAVKNIAEPVRVYKVLSEPEAAGRVIGKERPVRWRWAAIGAAVVIILVAGALAIWNFYLRPPFERASVERMALPLPDKPSIAVLPFVNMSEDPKQEFFSDGITEDIITALSKTPRLFVIARNSTFIYKGKPKKVQEVAEELGVRYVLEGSVRKSENKVRITAQLIDALKGTHLWAEKYDRNLKDIFAIQDDITRQIIAALQVKLTEGEQARIWSRGTQNMKAYEKALESLEHFRRFNPDDFILCRKKAEEALALDPNYPFAVALLAWSHLAEVWNGWSKSPGDSMKKAVELGQKTLALDENYEGAHSLLGSIYLVQRQWDKAIEAGQRAVDLSPSGADANGIFGITLRYVGRSKEAILLFNKAIRLNPSAPNWLYHNLGAAQISVGNYQKAVTSLKRVIEKNPKHIPARFYLIVAYSLSNQDEEAKIQVGEYLKLRPSANIGNERKRLPFKNETDLKLIVNALRKAGLPETPPLPLPDKPSIAVLPFTNLSDDPKQEYFVDGMTDDLITDLSKISGLFVIARNSVFRYKGKPVDVKKVSRELGVQHMLEGSVRKAGNQVRINAQLIDASTGGHLWAERYDGKMDDVFALQDKITKEIVTALAVKLTGGEQKQVTRKETDNIAAYDAFLKGWGHYRRRTPKDWAKAVSYFKKAIEFDPKYTRAYAALASLYYWSYRYWWFSSLGIRDFTDAFKLTRHYTQMAMKNPTSHAYRNASQMSLRYHQYEQAIAEAERAIALDPNDPDSFIQMARVLIFAGRPKEAVGFIKNAMRLDPHYPAEYQFIHGLAYFAMGQLEEAVTLLESAVMRNPDVPLWGVPLAVTYAHLSRDQEAHAMYDRIGFHFLSPGYAGWWWPFKDPEVADRFTDGLRKARMK
jgi:adenylate cyclase